MSYATADDEHRDREREEKRRLSRQQIIEHVKKSLLYTPFGCTWVHATPLLVVVGQYPNNNGALCMYKLSNGELQVVSERRLPLPLKCTTMRQAVGGQAHVAVGDFAGGLRVYDVEATDAPLFEVARAHETIVNAIDGAVHQGPTELVTGSRDGSVRVWDTREPRRPIVQLTPTDKSLARDCWTVRFGNSVGCDDRWIVGGYDNGDIKIFDMRTNTMVQEFNVGNGVCDVEFDRSDIPANKLQVGTLEGRVRVYDLRTRHPKLGYAYVEDRVTSGTVWSVRSLPQNREIFACGGAGEVTLSKYVYPPERALRDPDGDMKGVAGSIEELNKVKLSDQPINSLDWNSGKEGLLAGTSFDQCVRVMLVTRLSMVS